VGKKKIIKRYEQLPDEILEKVKEKYPDGFEDYLISFTNPKGEIEFGLPYDTEEVSYLIKMPKSTVSDEEEDFDSSTTFGGFDNFENIDIVDEVEEDEEE
jgi:DNA-directed RNA polymerase subunit delta